MKHMMDKHVGVLMGGLGPEREVSLRSGDAVADALAGRGYRVSRVIVDRDIDRVLRQNPIDVAFIALHGPFGEDGCVQGLLEMLGVPYTGSGVLASALAMDKAKAKELFRLFNVPTPPYYVVPADAFAEAADGQQHELLENLHGSFGFPVFIKPRRGGSSVGAGRAASLAEARVRIEDAGRYDDQVLVERLVKGREVAVGILDGRALGAIEVEPADAFYDYRSKYQSGRSRYHFPARLGATRYQGVLNIAERAARAVGAVGACRVDLLVTEGENEYVLEVNTVPGLTPTSLLPKVAAGAGYDFADLCEAMLERAGLGNRLGAVPLDPGTEERGAPLAPKAL